MMERAARRQYYFLLRVISSSSLRACSLVCHNPKILLRRMYERPQFAYTWKRVLPSPHSSSNSDYLARLLHWFSLLTTTTYEPTPTRASIPQISFLKSSIERALKVHIFISIMRISSALLPLLASINVCSGFTTTLPPSTPKSLVRQLISSRQHNSNIINNGVSSSSSQLSVATSTSEIGTPGTADLPWSELGFEFRPTKSHLRMVYRDGKWGEAELVEVR